MTTNTITNTFENHLLSIKAERQNMIHPNSHPSYNQRQQKIIEMIDWTLEKYKEVTNIQNNQQNKEAIIIDNIIEQLDKKRDISINKKKKALLWDEVSIFRLEETTLDYILFIIRELTGNKLYKYNKNKEKGSNTYSGAKIRVQCGNIRISSLAYNY
jgi:hypothetical protein